VCGNWIVSLIVMTVFLFQVSALSGCAKDAPIRATAERKQV
jgi:hypothetical protein